MNYLSEIEKLKENIESSYDSILLQRRHYDIQLEIPIVNNYLNDYLNEVIIGYKNKEKKFIIDTGGKIQSEILINNVHIESLALFHDSVLKKEYTIL